VNVEYLTDIILLLSAAVIIVPLFQVTRLGAIPGFLVAGVLLGPSGLGYIENNDNITRFAELGVVLLLFVIGVEINPLRLWRMKGLVLGLGTLQVLITGGLITILVHELFSLSWNISILTGSALALSSTAFVLQLLSDRKMLSSGYGRPAVSVLLLQDLAVVPLLAFVSLMAAPNFAIAGNFFLALVEGVAILFVIIIAARHILNPLLKILARFGSPEIFTATALLLVLGSAQSMELIGLSMPMGAFIAGLLIADSSYRHQILAEVQPFRGLLLGLFFISMGMSVNLDHFPEHTFELAASVIALLAIKFVTLYPLSRLFGVGSKDSVSVSLLLAQGGEFALVLFALAKGLGLLDETMFQYLLIVVMLSMLVTPLLDKLAHVIYISSRRDNLGSPNEELDKIEQAASPVILAGFGRMGRRIGSILDLMEVPYEAIDIDTTVVECERSAGRTVKYGDATHPEVLRAAGAADARIVIVSIDDYEATERVVSTLHTSFPDLPVFVRGHSLSKCRGLEALGAYYTVSETLEASVELARAALLHMGVDDMKVAKVLERFRSDYYGRADKDVHDN